MPEDICVYSMERRDFLHVLEQMDPRRIYTSNREICKRMKQHGDVLKLSYREQQKAENHAEAAAEAFGKKSYISATYHATWCCYHSIVSGIAGYLGE